MATQDLASLQDKTDPEAFLLAIVLDTDIRVVAGGHRGVDGATLAACSSWHWYCGL